MEVLLEDVDGMLLAFGREVGDAFERIGDAQLLVLVGAHGVVGEEFDAFHIGIGCEVLGKGMEAGVVICVIGHEDMANPGGLSCLVQVVEESLVVLTGMSRVSGVERVIKGLDVEEHKVGVFQHLADFLVEDDTAGVEGGVETSLLAEAEESDEKVCLHEGFATRTGDTALLDEGLVTLDLFEELLGREFILHGCMKAPRVGVVTEGAPHGTALQESDKADAGTIDCTKRFDAMNVTVHGTGIF